MHLRLRLRPWQEEALRLWIDAGCRGVAEVATGGGKTALAEACMQHVAAAHPDTLFVIVVPTVALLDQWVVSLQEDLGVPPNDVSSRPPAPNERLARIHVSVVNTARKDVWYARVSRPVMLIVDECHRAGAPENARALRGTFIATLGLSATPQRQYDSGFDERVEPVLGPIFYRYDLAEARADNVLSPFDLVNVRVALTSHEQREYARLTKRVAILMNAKDLEPTRVEAVLRQRSRLSTNAMMRVPVAALLAEQHRGLRTMIFHESVPGVRRIASLLRERGTSVVEYHTGIAPTIRRRNLLLYRRGIIATLVSCRALDEGVNIPETQIAIIASSTATLRQRVQRLGRVLRPAPGKHHATIYTIYATKHEEERLAAEAADLLGTAGVRWTAVELPHG